MEREIIVISECLLISILFVCSLYVWTNTHDRNHPSTIKKRFISVTIVMLITPLYLYLCVDHRYLAKYALPELMGFRIEKLAEGICYPVILTMLLFLGPIVGQISKGTCSQYTSCRYWMSNICDVVWLRNQVMGPLSEEVIYRACLIPLLVQIYDKITVMFIVPLFFGASHYSHFIDSVKSGKEWKMAFCNTSFTFLYTYAFGMYAAFLFLRTGHVASAIAVHVFCNHMGFPEFSQITDYQGLVRYLLLACYLGGLFAWCIALLPATQPHFYDNIIFWNDTFPLIP